jgi:cold shock CspA family protein
MKRERGTVKWFSSEKGWGFIRLDDSGEEVFVHHSAIQGEGFVSLRQGEAVELVVEHEDRGPRARDVVSLDETPGSGGGNGAGGKAADGRGRRRDRDRNGSRTTPGGGRKRGQRGERRDAGSSTPSGSAGNGGGPSDDRSGSSVETREGTQTLAEQVRRRLAKRFSFLR